MTLAQRLLVAIGILTIATTVALGFGVREAWRRAEEERFQSQFLRASASLSSELKSQLSDLPRLVSPLCAHDPMLDSALVGLKSGDLGSRKLSISLRVPELMKGLRLDELTLVTSRGEILGTGHSEGQVGWRDPRLAETVRKTSTAGRLRQEGVLAVEAACIKQDSRRPELWVGLYAARHLEPLLERVARNHTLRLTIGQQPASAGELREALVLPELSGLTLTASLSREPLLRALRRLDVTILALGAGTFVVALLLAALMARGLARPIVALSTQAQQVVLGSPQPVVPRGGKELEGLVIAFNQAILDLVLLRKRLAATERIAARREIARQVAHEIKNPLAPIRAAVETLRRLRQRNDPAFDQYFDEATRTVLDEVARITTIVSEFTRYARLPAPDPKPFDPVEAVRGVVNLHKTSGANLSFDDQPCPELNADRDQLIQVATNLIQNAIEAARDRPEPRVWVSVRCASEQDFLLSVRDNGPGILPEVRQRLFEPYATTKSAGTGLGLSIAQRIVLEHGGEITVHDPPGGGAEFRVALPLAGPALLPEPPPSSVAGEADSHQ